MNGPTSPTEIVARWADEAAAAAARDAVAEENLRALLGQRYDGARAWSHARAAYTAMVARLRSAATPLVLKLVVPLADRPALESPPPAFEAIQDDIDPRDTPPMLVVQPPLFERGWSETEWYRRPFEPAVFIDASGEPFARGIYVVFRTKWDADGDYHRNLTFERVQNVPGVT